MAQILRRVREGLLGRPVEPGDAEISDIAALDAPRHRLQFERLALQLQVDRPAVAAAQSQLDLAARGAAQLLLRLAEGQIVSRLLVDRENHVSGFDAGLRRRRPVLRGDHLQLSVLDRHHHSDAGHVVVSRVLHCLVGGLVEKGRARIEPGQHAGDRRIDQLCVADRIDRILTDPLERFVEEVELFVNAILAGLLLSKNTACYK